MKIAIVGSGIAGLSAAWLLGRHHQVTLFERHGRPGMGAHNLDYTFSNQTVRIDVPIRAFNQNHYRNLVRFYDLMGVETLRTDHSAAYSHPSAKQPFFAYRYLDIGRRSLPRPAGWRHWSLDSVKIARDAFRFLITARRDQRRGFTKGQTIAEYMISRGYSALFSEQVLLPSFAAIGTCSYRAIRQYPADTIIDFMTSGLLFNGIWRAKSGADDAIARMLEHCDQLICNTSIVSIRTHVRKGQPAGVVLEDNQKNRHTFDRVVLAVQANQAADMLGDEEREARKYLRSVGYERSEVVVHTDARLAPGHGQSSPPVLFEVDSLQDKPMASICLNKLYPSLKKAPAIFQTWNPLREPAPGTVVGRAFFERPLVTLESQDSIQKLRQLNQDPNRLIGFSGSFAHPGIPLLESALQSSMDIARHWGVDIPWSI